MSEDELIKLGFEKQIENEKGEDTFHYYTYTIVNGIELISNGSYELEEDEWFVHFFESEPQIEFVNAEEVQKLIKLLSKRIKKK